MFRKNIILIFILQLQESAEKDAPILKAFLEKRTTECQCYFPKAAASPPLLCAPCETSLEGCSATTKSRLLKPRRRGKADPAAVARDVIRTYNKSVFVIMGLESEIHCKELEHQDLQSLKSLLTAYIKVARASGVYDRVFNRKRRKGPNSDDPDDPSSKRRKDGYESDVSSIPSTLVRGLGAVDMEDEDSS